MKSIARLTVAAVAAFLIAGCASYRWTCRVPQDMRVVSVPTFENASSGAELGTFVTRHLRREIEREGSFKLARTGKSALEIQGSVKTATRSSAGYDRVSENASQEYFYIVTADVTLVDKKNGRVLFSGREFKAETTFFPNGDILTAQRNSADRVAEDLARQIYDAVWSFPYNRPVSAK